MLGIMPKSAVLNYTIRAITHLKWAWDFILYISFFQTRGGIGSIHDYSDDGIGITQYSKNVDSDDDSPECAVCLCRIDDGDEIRELRCNHLFHKACLDRWLGYGHATCPLCRTNCKPTRFSPDLLQELVLINFTAARSADDRQMWWLR